MRLRQCTAANRADLLMSTLTSVSSSWTVYPPGQQVWRSELRNCRLMHVCGKKTTTVLACLPSLRLQQIFPTAALTQPWLVRKKIPPVLTSTLSCSLSEFLVSISSESSCNQNRIANYHVRQQQHVQKIDSPPYKIISNYFSQRALVDGMLLASEFVLITPSKVTPTSNEIWFTGVCKI